MQRWQRWSCQRCWRPSGGGRRREGKAAGWLPGGGDSSLGGTICGAKHKSFTPLIADFFSYSLPYVTCEFDRCYYRLELASRPEITHLAITVITINFLMLNKNSMKNGVSLPAWGFHLSMAFPKAWLGWFGVCDAGPGPGAEPLGVTQALQASAPLASPNPKLRNFWGDGSLVWWHHTQTSSAASPRKKTKNRSFLP